MDDGEDRQCIELEAASVAEAVGLDGADLVDTMTTMFERVIPELRHDESLRQLMVASTASNLSAIFDLLTLRLGHEHVVVPPAAAEYARRFAQHDLPVEALVRAYRLGEHHFLQRVLTEVGERGLDTETAVEVVGAIAAGANRYIDTVIGGLLAIYEDERRRWDAREDVSRRAAVREVLDRTDLDEGTAASMLGVALGDWHLAAVVSIPSGVVDDATRLRTGAALLASATELTPFAVPVDDQTAWLWVSSPRPPAVDDARLEAGLAKRPDIRLALGEPDRGLAGFRRTLREAQRARAVAATRAPAGAEGRLVRYRDVAVASLAVDVPGEGRDWARRVLGDLAADDPDTAEVRRTVRRYLATNRSTTEAARLLHVHKNTVGYRVAKAERLLGRHLDEDRLAIEVALELQRHLG
ncbi:MAG: PucR family transcriptional regulator [Acidimicrobiales bacterium]